MTTSTRRADLGATHVSPPASVPAVATPVSPELAQLIAQHDAHRAEMDDHAEDEFPSREVCREAGHLRALIVSYPSQGLADTMAKAACLARLWPLDEAEEDLAHQLKDGHAYLECMALGIACEVMRYGEGASCT